ncbi:MAG: RDD family protein [Nitrospiria bacterium]
MDMIDPASGEADPRPPGNNTPKLKERSTLPPLRKKVIVVPRPAGFLRRAISFCIDLMIISGLYLVLVLVGIMGIGKAENVGGVLVLSEVFTSFFSGGFFLFVGYFTFFHAYDGQTPAKMILRIKVIAMDGRQLSPLHSALRAGGYFLSGPLSFGFGFLFSIIERKKRALHDLLTASQVVLSP